MFEEELLEIIFAYIPATFEGWMGVAVAACALVSMAVPAPDETSHPAWKIGHRIISIIGLGAGKLRAAGKLGKIANAIRRKM